MLRPCEVYGGGPLRNQTGSPAAVICLIASPGRLERLYLLTRRLHYIGHKPISSTRVDVSSHLLVHSSDLT
jgi:hypothetical protein